MPDFAYEHLRDMWLVWKRVQVGEGFMYIRVGHVKQTSAYGRPSWTAMDNLCKPISSNHATRREAAQAIGVTQ